MINIQAAWKIEELILDTLLRFKCGRHLRTAPYYAKTAQKIDFFFIFQCSYQSKLIYSFIVNRLYSLP